MTDNTGKTYTPSSVQKELAASGLKRCPQCECVKPVNKFGRNKRRPDGLQSTCKTCRLPQSRQWFKDNTERMAYHQRKRRAHRQEVNEHFTEADVAYCLERAGHKCEACGMTNEEHKERWNERLHMDHILPLSEGHALTRDNCQVLCKSCNSSKHTSQTSYRETPKR